MRKIVAHAAGSYDRLRLGEHPDPIPAACEVLLEVQAVGVNYADCVVRMGRYESAKKYVAGRSRPASRSSAPSPRSAKASRISRWGARVFGVTRFGGYASRVVLPRHQVFALPQRITLPQAAGFPAVFMTAYFALHELLRIQLGMTVLARSAAGGVGGAPQARQDRRLPHDRRGGRLAQGRHDEAPRSRRRDRQEPRIALDRCETDRTRGLRRDPRRERGRDAAAELPAPRTGREARRLRLPHYAPATGGRPNYAKLALDFVRTPRFNPLDLCNDNKSVLAFNLSYLFHKAEILREGMDRLVGWVEEGASRRRR